MTGANILNGLRDRGVTKVRTPSQGRCSPAEEHQFRQKSHSKPGISVIAQIRGYISSNFTSRDVPAQLRCRGSWRTRTRHLQWDRATSSNFRLHFEIYQMPGLGLEALREWHWESRSTATGQLGDGRRCLCLLACYTPSKQV